MLKTAEELLCDGFQRIVANPEQDGEMHDIDCCESQLKIVR